MRKKTNTSGPVSKNCPTCGRPIEAEGRLPIPQVLSNVIAGFEDRMKASDFKPTMGDYLRLLQMVRESEEEGPKDIRVTWVDQADSHK